MTRIIRFSEKIGQELCGFSRDKQKGPHMARPWRAFSINKRLRQQAGV
jgi:hypothetical protein